MTVSGERRQFQRLLHGAIASGRVPAAASGLGPQTVSAIAAVAAAHPEASIQLVIAAWEAFASDQHSMLSTDRRPRQARVR
jgi:hypothetical protein